VTILDDIIAYKKQEVRAAKAEKPFSALDAELSRATPVRGFYEKLCRKANRGEYALIAEIKKASPSKGVIRADFQPTEHARAYELGGAACLSVLTDGPSFQGAPEFMMDARAATTLPVLRKDFMIDAYQIIEARSWGADCVLLILACLDDALAEELFAAATSCDLDVLVEVHDEAEMDRALALGARLIGVNNRNLKTFETSLDTTARLSRLVPEDILLVSESGIRTTEDLATLRSHGARAFLVGETLMREPDIALATKRLLGALSG
jgi:indole-3-glycerol phosphate synthase